MLCAISVCIAWAVKKFTFSPACVPFWTECLVASPNDTCLHPNSATMISHSLPLMLPGGPTIAQVTGRFRRSSARRAASAVRADCSSSFFFFSAASVSLFSSSSFFFLSASSSAAFFSASYNWWSSACVSRVIPPPI